MDKRPEEETRNSDSQPAAETITNRKPAQTRVKQRKASPLLLLLVLLAAATIGLWFWQQDKIKNLNQRITTTEQEAIAREQALKQTPIKNDESVPPVATGGSVAVSDNLVPGVQEISDNRVTINTLFKYKEGLSALWIEYGVNPANLDLATPKATRELGLGSPEAVYLTYDFLLNAAELKPGTRYYFRAVGQYGEKVEKSGLASFVTRK